MAPPHCRAKLSTMKPLSTDAPLKKQLCQIIKVALGRKKLCVCVFGGEIKEYQIIMVQYSGLCRCQISVTTVSFCIIPKYIQSASRVWSRCISDSFWTHLNLAMYLSCSVHTWNYYMVDVCWKMCVQALFCNLKIHYRGDGSWEGESLQSYWIC